MLFQQNVLFHSIQYSIKTILLEKALIFDLYPFLDVV